MKKSFIYSLIFGLSIIVVGAQRLSAQRIPPYMPGTIGTLGLPSGNTFGGRYPPQLNSPYSLGGRSPGQVPGLAGPTLRRIRRIGARTELDRDRFVSLGVPADRIEITGDLKLEPVEQAAPLSPDLSEVLGVRPLVVAGSTHPGEEEQVLDALSAATGAQDSALVIAPRHVQRAIEVERLVRSHGRSVRRRTTSQPRPLAAGEVLILDTVGELAAVYARAAAAFVGGTLVPVGGHNVLEPASAGCPVLHGPHVANIRHAVELLEACDAVRIVKGVADLASALSEILGDPEAAAKRGERAIAMLREHRGCTDRTAELVDAVLSENAVD